MMFKLLVFSVGRKNHPLQFGKVLTPVLVKSTRSSAITSCQLTRKAKLLAGLNRKNSKILLAPNSSEVPGKIILNHQQKESVSEQLKLFNESLSLKSMVFLLGWVGRTLNQSVEEMEKKLSNQESNSFIMLLNCITDNISQLQHHQLAFVAGSLAKIKSCEHPLIKVCENEIISRGLGTFDYKSLTQIVWAFSKLNTKNSSLFEEIERAVVNRELSLAEFDVRGIAQTLMAFGVTKNGSLELFQICAQEMLSRDFSVFGNKDLAQIGWSFAKREAEANQLFDKIEAELFRRGVSNIMGGDIAMLLWSFASAKQKKEDLFKALESQILSLRNLNGFTDRDLSYTIWALEKVGGTAAIKKLEAEVKRRGMESDVTDENVNSNPT